MLARAGGFEDRLRGEAEQPSDDWQGARASDTGGAGLRFLAANLVPHFLGRKSGPIFPLNMTSVRGGG